MCVVKMIKMNQSEVKVDSGQMPENGTPPSAHTSRAKQAENVQKGKHMQPHLGRQHKYFFGVFKCILILAKFLY